MAYRESLLEGELPYPGMQIYLDFTELAEVIDRFWKAIWLNFLNDNKVSGPYWYKELGARCYNSMVRRLDHHGWVISNSLPGRKWADVELNTNKLFEYISEGELMEIKRKYKYKKYLLDDSIATSENLVRQNGVTKRTGLVRKGFRDAGNTLFQYDMDMLKKYEESVKLNLTKSMDKIREDYPKMKSDAASYDVVSCGIFDWHYQNKQSYFTTGENINDSRGRAISRGLGKIANPIGNKDFRSALIITYDM